MAELKVSMAKPCIRSDGVSLWGWTGSALDEGDEAAKWFTDFIGEPTRLVRFNDESETRRADPVYASGFNVKFPDSFPFLLISEIPSINQEDATQGSEPTQSMMKFRSGKALEVNTTISKIKESVVYLGQMLVCPEKNKFVSVGDMIEVEKIFLFICRCSCLNSIYIYIYIYSRLIIKIYKPN
ncbi:hypothetical protein R6Q59_026412 [Mikania micrantha]